MHKKLSYWFLLVVSLVNLVGCWSRSEVEDLGIISVIGIDRVEIEGQKKWKVSALVIRPPQLGGNQPPSAEINPDWLLSEVGDTLYDAGRNLARRSPRALVLFHNDLIIIGEKAARTELQEVIDYLQRHKDIRLRNQIVVGREAPERIMETLPEIEQTIGTEVTEVIRTSGPKVSETISVDLNKFTHSLIGSGEDPLVPVLGTFTPSEAVGTQRGQKEPVETTIIQGLAVFRQGKLVGYVLAEEAKGFLYVLGKSESGILPINFKNENRISIMMRRSNTKYKPKIKEGRLVMELIITAEADIVEVTGSLPVGDPKVIEELEKEFTKEVKKRVAQAVSKAQKKYKADVFGFGRHVHIAYPDYWHEIEKDWYDIYPEVPVNIKVQGTLKGTVSISDPFVVR